MNVLANDNKLSKYIIEILNKVEALFNGIAFDGIAFSRVPLNKKVFHGGPADNDEYIRTRISSYNEN